MTPTLTAPAPPPPPPRSFVLDVIITFFLPYRTPAREGGNLVYDHRRIARAYLKGWFFIDVFTCIPFDSIMTVLLEVDGSETNGKLFRLLRMLRILKLMRIIRASRIIARWQDHISLPFALISLIKFTFLTIVLAHWLACYWGFLADTEPAVIEMEWENHGQGLSWRQKANIPADATPMQLYGICLYTSLNNSNMEELGRRAIR